MDPKSNDKEKDDNNEEQPKYIALPKPKHLCGKGKHNAFPQPIERVEMKKNI
jgi:hypothetical protein